MNLIKSAIQTLLGLLVSVLLGRLVYGTFQFNGFILLVTIVLIPVYSLYEANYEKLRAVINAVLNALHIEKRI